MIKNYDLFSIFSENENHCVRGVINGEDIVLQKQSKPSIIPESVTSNEVIIIQRFSEVKLVLCFVISYISC